LSVPDEGYSKNESLRTKFDIYVFIQCIEYTIMAFMKSEYP